MNWPTPSGRIVIAGGSGFLGQSLARHLVALGCEVIILTRSASKISEAVGEHVQWDARTLGEWKNCLDGANGLVNLVGRTVDCIKTPENCDAILRSRVEATTVLGEASRAVENPPPVWVQMSTAHIYGDPPNSPSTPKIVCDENSAFGYGLAPTVGKEWEDALHAAASNEIRKVVLRTSFVIGKDGGALKRLGFLARIGLGGTVGHGRQGMSWIAEHDMNRIFERALTDDTMTGAYIASSPTPVSNKAFMKTLRMAIGMPIGLPAFAWMVKIGAPLLMRTDPELALYGRYVMPKRLLDEGFEFEYPELADALEEIL